MEPIVGILHSCVRAIQFAPGPSRVQFGGPSMRYD